MSEVKRYGFQQGTGFFGPHDGGCYVRSYDFDAQRLRADTAEAELAEKIRDEANLKIIVEAAKNNLEELRESRDSFQRVGIQTMEKLAAAEQRIAELTDLLAGVVSDTARWMLPGDLHERIRAALNPNPEAESHE